MQQSSPDVPIQDYQQYQFFVGAQSSKGVLTWNPNGSLGSLQITDSINASNNQTCNFGYDDVARLTGDNCGSVWSQTYSYDQYDNLTKSGSASWIPGYNQANNQYQNGATYDANGNLTNDGAGNTYTWDAYGKMATVNGTGITYDAFGRPVAKTNSIEILYTPLGKVGVLNTSTTFWNAYVPLPGGGAMSLGCCGGTNIWYLHRDWLGTSRVISSVPASGNGAAANDRSFSPYGDVSLNGGYNDPLLFAGMNSDLFATSGTASGLYDTPNRELGINASRWLSPDPAHASWNAYAYPTNPNSFSDPSGAIMLPPQLHDLPQPEDFDLSDGERFLYFGDSTTPYGVVRSRIIYSGAGVQRAYQDAVNEQTNAQDWAAFAMVFGTFGAADPLVQSGYGLATCNGYISCGVAAVGGALTVATLGESAGLTSAAESAVADAAESAAETAATETFYRTMSEEDYGQLLQTGQIPATGETFISPSLEYAQQYNGVTVQLDVQAGTTDALLEMGVRNVGLNGDAYSGLPLVQSGWGSSSAFFKLEGNVVNIGLGNGSALNTFNTNIVNFSVVR